MPSLALTELAENGFSFIENLYSVEETEKILAILDQVNSDKATFRKSVDIFAIRQFLNEVPEIAALVFNSNLNTLIQGILGPNFFVVKSIYFDKPETSNWHVPYHQDITISVDKKIELSGFSSWTTKQNQFSVQAPLEILQNIVTIRIHLDDTDNGNGALRVIPKSHLKGIYQTNEINGNLSGEVACILPQGGAMLMKPLILHSSSRTTNHKKRRVIHIEFSNLELPSELNWAEKLFPPHSIQA